MPDTFYVLSRESHERLVISAFKHRGYHSTEAKAVARLCDDASRNGIHTHNAIKALHLDELFGSKVGGCRPGASIKKYPRKFATAQIWNANRRIGPAVAYKAIEACIEMADRHGIGMVSVDEAWHYLWGGGYVLEAARRGYIAYTNCTAMLAEVVPFGGSRPTLGTNPHSWAFPTTDILGFPVLVDWATSLVAMGRVQQLKREGKRLPAGIAVDKAGKATEDPNEVAALLPFGAHKGYGLGLIDELYAAYIGGSLPTIRGRFTPDGRKHTTNFFFQVIHPDAICSGHYECGRSTGENVKAVIDDILGAGNEGAILPGQIEATWVQRSQEAGGLLFTRAEMEAFNRIADECGCSPWNLEELPTATF